MEKALFVKLDPNAKIPTQGSEKAAGYDLYSCNPDTVRIMPGTCEKISTGLAITPPDGYAGWILPRSGLATKNGLRPANTPGLCDQDYTGAYIVALYNDSDEVQEIPSGTRIAQLVFLPWIQVEWTEVDSLEQTKRGANGFNSTGTN